MLDLVDFTGSAGVDGIVLFGAAGEFIHFTPGERSRFVALTAKRSRVPVIANVSHSTLDAALLMAEEAVGGGIAAAMIMPPYFYRYPAETLEAFCLEFATQAARWIPVILCDLPCGGNALSLDAARRLLGTGLFAGVVVAGDSMARITELAPLQPATGVAVFTGRDRDFVAARRAGASGIVSETAAAIPELIVSLDRAMQTGAAQTAERLEYRLHEFIDIAEALPPLVAIREACSLRGLKSGPAAGPLGPEAAKRCDEFRSWFGEWLPAVLKECSGVSV
jgi:4-hydroxy-tetrahydrodipicolinate synthase